MRDHAGYMRSRAAGQAIARDFDTGAEDADPPADIHASTCERLEYIAAMIAELRDMAGAVPQSSLPAILDSALAETRIQLTRSGK